MIVYNTAYNEEVSTRISTNGILVGTSNNQPSYLSAHVNNLYGYKHTHSYDELNLSVSDGTSLPQLPFYQPVSPLQPSNDDFDNKNNGKL